MTHGAMVRRALVAFSTAVVLTASLAGCGDDEADAGQVPDGVLTAEQVGGVVEDPRIGAEPTVANLCGPDGMLFPMDDSASLVEYPRAESTVMVGTWGAPPGGDSKLRGVEERARSRYCADPAPAQHPDGDTWRVRLLDSFPRGTVAFQSVRTREEPSAGHTVAGEDADSIGTHTTARAYTLVGNTVVTVWITTEGDDQPSVDELRGLLAKQVETTRG